MITEGLFIGKFKEDDIRTHHKRFLKMASILRRIPQPCSIDCSQTYRVARALAMLYLTELTRSVKFSRQVER